MPFRFRRTIKIAPGIRLNLNKKSSSIRFGGRGAGVTVSSTGKTTRTIGVPGTGAYWTKTERGTSARGTSPARTGCASTALFALIFSTLIFGSVLFAVFG